MEKKAVIVNTIDDVNDYFLVIDLATGTELGRRSTEDYGTWRFDDGYDFDKILRKVADEFNLDVEEYSLITW